MIFKHTLLDINDSNCYVLACENTREAVLIDPGEYHRDIADFMRRNRLEVKYVFITHAHYDHASGLEDFLRSFGGKVLARQPGYFSRAQKVEHGDRIPFGYYEGIVLSTPGHTMDSISLVVEDMVFCGDILFCGSLGSVKDNKCYEMQLDSIRQHLLKRSDTTKIFPGHGPATTVGLERMFNPFLIS